MPATAASMPNWCGTATSKAKSARGLVARTQTTRKAKCTLDSKVRMNEARQQSLRVTIDSIQKGGSVEHRKQRLLGRADSRAGQSYSFSISVKGGETIRRQEAQDQSAQRDIGPNLCGSGTRCRDDRLAKVQRHAHSRRHDNNGRLVITADDAGEFWLGYGVALSADLSRTSRMGCGPTWRSCSPT